MYAVSISSFIFRVDLLCDKLCTFLLPISFLIGNSHQLFEYQCKTKTCYRPVEN